MASQNHELATATGSTRNRPLTHRPPDPFAGLNPDPSEERKKLSELCKATYDKCRQIDNHFLKACLMSAVFVDHPFSGSQLKSFEDDIKAYETAVTSRAPEYAAADSAVAVAFANDSHMKDLWGPVVNHLARSPGGKESYYNNNPPWNTWVRDLDRITSTLPDLLVQILASPSAKYDEEQWKAIGEKVAFIDGTLDYAHHNDYLGIQKRQIHLGTETNTKLRDSSLFRGRPVPVFEENTPWNPRFRKDARKTPQVSFLSQRDQGNVTLVVWVCSIVALLLLIVGWNFSGSERGKWRDPDQWFLAQTCLLQILGVYVIYQTTPVHFGLKLWVLMFFSVAFSAGAPIVYVRAPTKCSALTACIGAALQNLVIVESMFAVWEEKKVKTT